MPLANEIPREEVVVEGLLPDGTPYRDVYILRGALGHYDMTRLLLAGVGIRDLSYFNRDKEGGEQNGEQVEVEPDPDPSAGEQVEAEAEPDPDPNVGEMMSERNLRIFKTWLVDWSHDAPLIDENIREIMPAAAKAIMAKIKSIKEDAQKQPFRGEPESEGLPGANHPGEGDQQLDDLHPEGAGIEGV